MSKAYNSPTARLLQSSRLFSLPRPLPQAALENTSSTGAHRASETATQIYPTHQAITTPSSSHFRGDWGLKRPIPGKTTKASIPSIRVLGQDTPDHITEFESATDHERTRAKWAEMGIPIMANTNKSSSDRKPAMSVYEDFLDNTDPDAQPVNLRSGPDANVSPMYAEAKRWKYSGPFVAGMQEGEFNRYVERQLRERRAEWTEFLMDHFAEENFEEERRMAQQSGQWHGPAKCAPPGFLAQLIIAPAEEQAANLLKEALVLKSAEEEAKARLEGELLVDQARAEAEEYEAEAKQWEAPEEARNIIKQAQRAAHSERASVERSGEEIDHFELENRTNGILADGIAAAYSRLGAEAPVGSVDIAAVNQLIQKTEAAVRTKKAEKTVLWDEWKTARLPKLRPSPEHLAVLEKGLRDDHKSLGSPLAALLTRFLDIPAVNNKDPKKAVSAKSLGLAREVDSLTNDREEAPPTTHPAAGLSHIRTDAFMENHPIYGPQAQPSPILSRVLMTRNSVRNPSSRAMLGVGGFAALDPNMGTNFGKGKSITRRGGEEDPTNMLNPEDKTGNKVYVRPHSARVDDAGRVHIAMSRADSEAIAVKEGNVEHIIEARSRGPNASRPFSVGLPPAAGRDRRRANYGFALPDKRPQPTEGFDAEVQGKSGEADALRDIAKLSQSFNQ
ncbi:hypothetical protein Q7P37_005872 [Cladosporium fusiforme]